MNRRIQAVHSRPAFQPIAIAELSHKKGKAISDLELITKRLVLSNVLLSKVAAPHFLSLSSESVSLLQEVVSLCRVLPYQPDTTVRQLSKAVVVLL